MFHFCGLEQVAKASRFIREEGGGRGNGEHGRAQQFKRSKSGPSISSLGIDLHRRHAHSENWMESQKRGQVGDGRLAHPDRQAAVNGATQDGILSQGDSDFRDGLRVIARRTQ